MIDCSVYMITFNEVATIARALKSVEDFKEIVVVDSGSTDGTCEIIKQFPKVKFFHRDWPGYAAQKQWALEQCTCDWVLNLDGDEVIPPKLAAKFEQVMAENKIDCLCFAHADYLLGHFCSSWHPRRKIRFFRRVNGHYDLSLKAHEQVILTEGSVIEYSREHLEHYGLSPVAKVVNKGNSYSSLKAEEKHLRGKHASKLKIVMVGPLAFFRNFIVRQGFRDGLSGYIGAKLAANYAFLKEVKLYEQDINAREVARQATAQPTRPGETK